MKKLFILAIFLVYSNAAFADSGISSVFVKNDEIVISTEDTGQVQLTHDGIPKDHPVWSKDGTMITFTEQTHKKVALDRLVVIDSSGKCLFSFLIHPVPSDPKKRLETSLGVGTGQSDFWCQSCPLSFLPRRSPVYDTDHDVK